MSAMQDPNADGETLYREFVAAVVFGVAAVAGDAGVFYAVLGEQLIKLAPELFVGDICNGTMRAIRDICGYGSQARPVPAS